MTTSLLKLWKHQEKCVQAIRNARAEGHTRIAAVVPTGGGKTVIFSHIAAEHLDAHPGDRVLILAHTDELVSQAAEEFAGVCTKYSVGIVKAEKDDYHADVVVGSLMTLRNAERRERIKNVSLIIVDECHHVMSKTYLSILEHFGCFDDAACRHCDGKGYRLTPEAPIYGIECDAPGCTEGRIASGTPGARRCWVAGFTATLSRGDGAELGKVWEKVAYKISINTLIRLGILKKPVGIQVTVPGLDLSKVRQSKGDYREDSLAEAMEVSMAPEIAAKAYVEHASDRFGMAFTSTVAGAYAITDELRKLGVTSEVIHGLLPDKERREINKRVHRGEIQVVSNCMALTEGFNWPLSSAALIMRPTRNTGLYQQIVGRVLRKHASRMDALIIDVTGVGATHHLASLVDLIGDEEKQSRKIDSSEGVDAERECPEGEDCGGDAPDYYTGPVVSREFDPLANASDRVWLQTVSECVPFLPAGKDAYVFLVPSTDPNASIDAWDVCWCTAHLTKGMDGGYTEHRGVELGYAMAWGEMEADERGGEGSGTLTAKKKRWRREPVSDAQRDLCRRLGIRVPDDARKGDVAQLLTAHNGSRRIDPIARMMKGNE